MNKPQVRIRQTRRIPWTRHFRYALEDVRRHKFLHVVTWVTIVLTVLMSGTFLLFASNVSGVISSWEAGVKIMAYLENGLPEEDLSRIRAQLEEDPDILSVHFISRKDALENLSSRMEGHATIFQDLPENPLPDAFELYVKPSSKGWQLVEAVTARVAQIEGVAEGESGGQWMGRMLKIASLFRFAAFGVGTLFFLVSVFIVSNTIRLAFYSKKEEVEIMRLVGAVEGFIKAPFYIQGIFLGFTGGLCGIILLYIVFQGLTFRMDPAFSALSFGFHFLSVSSIFGMLSLCVLVGLMGAYLSFRQEIGE